MSAKRMSVIHKSDMPQAICEMGGYEMLIRGQAHEAVKWFVTVHRPHGPIDGSALHDYLDLVRDAFKTGSMWWGNPTGWRYRWVVPGWGARLEANFRLQLKTGFIGLTKQTQLVARAFDELGIRLDETHAAFASMSLPDVGAELDDYVKREFERRREAG